MCLCAGVLILADTNNHVIRQIDLTANTVTTIAGQNGIAGWTPDGPANSSLVSAPSFVAIGPASGTLPGGDVYWSEVKTHIIRRYNGLLVSTVAGEPGAVGSADGPALSASFSSEGPGGIAFFGSDMFIADSCE